jgi:hypothetical protein
LVFFISFSEYSQPGLRTSSVLRSLWLQVATYLILVTVQGIQCLCPFFCPGIESLVIGPWQNQALNPGFPILKVQGWFPVPIQQLERKVFVWDLVLLHTLRHAAVLLAMPPCSPALVVHFYLLKVITYMILAFFLPSQTHTHTRTHTHPCFFSYRSWLSLPFEV